MLKLEIDNLEGLDDGLKGLYEEKDGKFRLKVDGIPDVGGLKAKNDELLTEAKQAKAKLKELQDAAEREKQALLEKSGDVEAVRKSYDGKIAKLTTDHEASVTALQSQLQALTVGQTATALASELAVQGSAAVLLPHIKSRLRMEMRDGVATTVVVDADGKPSAMTIDELKTELASNPAFAPIIVASKAAGGGASGGGNNGGGAAKKVLTRQQFDALTPAARMEHVKGGGQVT